MANPSLNVLKFNVDGASIWNPGVNGIGGVLRNNTGDVLRFFQSLLAMHKHVR